MQHLCAAALQGAVVGVLRQGCGLGVLPQVLRGLDLLVSALGQVIHALVELDRRAQRVFGQVGKVFGDVFGCDAEGLFGLNSGGSKVFEAGAAHAARCGQGGQGCCGLAHVFAKARPNRFGQRRQLPHAGTCGIARQQQRLSEFVSLFTALRISQGQHPTGSSGHREGVDEPHHIAAQRLGGVAHATKHVFQLTALLQQHGHGGLAALQAGDDVGELSGHTAHGGGGLLGAHAHVALSDFDGAKLIQVGLEHVSVDAALAGQGLEIFGRAFFSRLHGGGGALHAGNDAVGGAVELLGPGVGTIANAAHSLACRLCGLAHRIGHAFASALHSLEAFFGRTGVNAYLQLRFACVSHCCCSIGFVQGLRPQWFADRQRRHASLGRSGRLCP